MSDILVYLADNQFSLRRICYIMKKVIIIFLICVFNVLYLTSVSFAGVDFIIDFKPGSILFNTDDFYAESSSVKEKIDGYGSLLPNISLGIGFDTSRMYFDLTAGVGYLWNDIYTASMISIDAAGRFKLGRFVTLGPHISYVNLKPTWNGISSVDLEDTNGLIPGICFTVGGKKLAFSVNLDYLLNASFGIETSNGWMTNDDTLDISGFLLQLGTIFRF